ncbi:MAG: hypothetical protein QXK06_03495 [Candidatus Diapherotrites archaeon]
MAFSRLRLKLRQRKNKPSSVMLVNRIASSGGQTSNWVDRLGKVHAVGKKYAPKAARLGWKPIDSKEAEKKRMAELFESAKFKMLETRPGIASPRQAKRQQAREKRVSTRAMPQPVPVKA